MNQVCMNGACYFTCKWSISYILRSPPCTDKKKILHMCVCEREME